MKTDAVTHWPVPWLNLFNFTLNCTFDKTVDFEWIENVKTKKELTRHRSQIMLTRTKLYTNRCSTTRPKGQFQPLELRVAESNSASREVPRLLWNTKVYYSAQKSTPLVPIRNQVHLVTTFPGEAKFVPVVNQEPCHEDVSLA